MGSAFASSSSSSHSGSSSSSSSSVSVGSGASATASSASAMSMSGAAVSGVAPAATASSVASAPLAAATDAFAWGVQSLTATGADGAPQSVTVVGGPLAPLPVAGLGAGALGLAPGLADILANGPGPGSVELGAQEAPVGGTPDADTFVYRSGGGAETVVGFDPTEDRLVVLGAPVASLFYDADSGRAEVRLPDGGVVALHLAPPAAVPDVDPLGPW